MCGDRINTTCVNILLKIIHIPEIRIILFYLKCLTLKKQNKQKTKNEGFKEDYKSTRVCLGPVLECNVHTEIKCGLTFNVLPPPLGAWQ